MGSTKTAWLARRRRHARLRQRVLGTAERPRLSVFRSLSHIYAQIIDDTAGCTLVAASSLEPAVRQRANGSGKAEMATLVGSIVAERARDRGITTVVFDRGGFLYHGRVEAVAQAARKGGLLF